MTLELDEKEKDRLDRESYQNKLAGFVQRIAEELKEIKIMLREQITWRR